MCLCVYKHFKDTLVIPKAQTLTFRHLQEDKALVSILIKTSLAKVTNWEIGTVGVCECVCTCACTCLCAFSFCVSVHWDNVN